MTTRIRATRGRAMLLLTWTALIAGPGALRFAAAADDAPPALAAPIEKGQRVFSVGHSFHWFMPKIVAQLAQEAGIEGHTQLGARTSAARKSSSTGTSPTTRTPPRTRCGPARSTC